MKVVHKFSSPNNPSKIAEFFREKRLKANLSQQDVANALGFSTGQFISNWERGLAFPPMELLPKLVKLYKLNKSELMQLYLEEHKRLIKNALR